MKITAGFLFGVVSLGALSCASAVAAPDWVSVTDAPYSAACNWNDSTQLGTDDHVAIQNAVNANRNVYIPRDCYIGTSTITLGGIFPFQTIQGASPGSSGNVAGSGGGSRLIGASTSAPTILVTAAIPGITIKNLGITKPIAVTAGAGADGILYAGYVDVPVIDNVEVSRHYNGIHGSSTLYGIIRNSYVHNNVLHGILFDAPTIVNDFQWYVSETFSASNGGWGGLVVSGSNAALGNKSSQGTWSGFRTFNNVGGLGFVGNSAVPIQGIRINNSFLGADYYAEIFLNNTFNTYPHLITSTYLELNSSGQCIQLGGTNSYLLVSGTVATHCNVRDTVTGIVNMP